MTYSTRKTHRPLAAALLLGLAAGLALPGDAAANPRVDPANLQITLELSDDLKRALDKLLRQADKKAKRQIGGTKLQIQSVGDGLGDLLGGGEIGPGDLDPLCKDWDSSIAALKDLADSGDYNGDGTVDAADYAVWLKEIGTIEAYNKWRDNYGKTCK